MQFALDFRTKLCQDDDHFQAKNVQPGEQDMRGLGLFKDLKKG